MCAVLIVHTSETQDWATYLKLILETSHHFSEDSITLFFANDYELLQPEDQEVFYSSKCILLLVSVAFLDLYSHPEMQDIFEKALHPPHKVVAFMCGVSESDGLLDYFENWDNWRKLDSEDEPSTYVSTVLELISQENDWDQNQEQFNTEHEIPPLMPALEEHEELEQSHWFPPVEENPQVSYENPTQAASPTAVSSEHQTCLTVQPHRILCGTQVTIYIIMMNQLDTQTSVDVEFHCEHSTTRVPGVFVNEYTVSAPSPDMPAGDVSLHLYANESIVCSTTVTYYTEMEEVSSYFEKLLDPIQFLCQAFNITSNAAEELDDLFTNALKNQMPANGLQVFGVGQLEQENTLSNQRNVELPTLLHFSAKYGLKKLTSVLLQCPGALQAYSVVNKNGDYPNTLAEKSGFSDLRHVMDNYVKTVDLVKSEIEDSMTNTEDGDIYEPMANTSQNNIQEFSFEEDIYESMIRLNPEMQYDDLDSESQNPEEAMLRKFFQGQPGEHSEAVREDLPKNGYPGIRSVETEQDFAEIYEDEEDPYKMCCPEDIYDTVDDEQESSAVLNRPPAPIPRLFTDSEPEERKTYISTVFSTKETLYSVSNQAEKKAPKATVWPVSDGALSSAHDPYAGMKTPGQRQLISLQERVKVGALTVEEAVQEFKAWQFDQSKRSQSIRFQQDNLQRLRDSICRRHKERGRSGKADDLEITAPMQRSLQWGSHISVQCSVYEPTPRTVTQPPPVSRPPQRGSWQTGSTSSTSSSSSNRLSTLSTISYSSGADGELEEPPEIAPPPRPPRTVVEAPPTLPPPRVPRRTPERFPESVLHERYVSSPARALPQLPPQRPIPPPPVPRRSR